uniref:Putative major facilitator, sugar transporter-like, Major facilitator superfamily domain protein n=1 Tax=Helianthus annuus TaxID=4232 RepID=A0A251U367_HELAN
MAFFEYSFSRFTALVENNALQAAKDIGKVMNVPLSTIQEDVEMINTPNTRAALSNTYPFFSREFLRRHGRDLIAASINWLLIDIVFYSLNLFQYHAFRGLMKSKININLYQDAMQIAKYQALIAICATIPGYIVTVYMIDHVGRVKIQAAGFFFMAISLFTIAKVNKGDWGSNQGPGFIILYGLTFFFSNFGPNTTTFIVPAELLPARFRATCHGISGAVGKLGAIIGLIGFILASREQPKGIEASHTLMAMGGVCVLGFFVTYFFTRETMGRSLEENENIQAAGFFFMAISLFTIAKVNKGDWGSNQGPGFIILYGLTFFFSNFGPNTTTFIVPAELFPARFRATCHGISGAVGKLGAIIGLIGFILASREEPKGIEATHTLMAMGGVCVLGFFVTYFFTRETMGRSLEENENVDELTGVWFVRFWPHKVWDKRNEVNTGERMSLY